MTSPVLAENYTTAEFLVTEAPGTLSRGTVLFDNTGGALDLHLNAGVVYSLEAFGAPVITPAAHGTGTPGAIVLLTGGAVPPQLGGYQLQFTAPTTFNVIAPDGRELTPGVLGTPYADEIGFTATAGGTAFQAGDVVVVTLVAGLGYATPYVGTSPAAGIIYNQAYVPAGGTKLLTTIQRMAEVNLAELQWAVGVTAPQMAAAVVQLAALSIIAR